MGGQADGHIEIYWRGDNSGWSFHDSRYKHLEEIISFGLLTIRDRGLDLQTFIYATYIMITLIRLGHFLWIPVEYHILRITTLCTLKLFKQSGL
jgi:hypothetical protein